MKTNIYIYTYIYTQICMCIYILYHIYCIIPYDTILKYFYTILSIGIPGS